MALFITRAPKIIPTEKNASIMPKKLEFNFKILFIIYGIGTFIESPIKKFNTIKTTNMFRTFF